MGLSLKWQRPFTKGTIEEPEYFPCALVRQRNIPAISPPPRPGYKPIYNRNFLPLVSSPGRHKPIFFYLSVLFCYSPVTIELRDCDDINHLNPPTKLNN